jgi:crotonobetainyl-CoA:carnitine CoA-transferase CaiB-like acyl-CoA transferase
MSKAFEGIRVLDLSQVLAGPSCGLQLAMLGADVIKIEPPQGGDQMRNRVLASRFGDQDMAGAFLAMNMGKRSLALDIKAEQGKVILFDMIRGADVILHNFRAGVVDRLGLDYESVRAINPTIVYTVISGFGRTGPKAADPAYDGAVQAASGMMANNGTLDSGPLRTGYMPIDMMTGMTAAFATTAALLRKQRTGEGQLVDVAMLDCAIVLQAASYARHAVDDVQDARIGNQSIAGIPTASSFPTADGSMLSAAIMPNHVTGFFEVLSLSHLLEDPKFSTREAMVENKAEVQAVMIEALKADSAENWEKKLVAKGVPIAKINTMAEVMGLEQLTHRNIFTDMPRAEGIEEDFRMVGAPYVTDTDGPEVMSAPPRLGQQSREVLEGLGISSEAADALIADGVVAVPR